MKLTIPVKTKNESNQRSHWAERARRAKAARTKARLLTKSALVKEPLRAALAVTMTRLGPRELDDDGLRSALKAVRDGIADALCVNDNTPLVSWYYRQGRGEPSVTVEVEPLMGQVPFDMLKALHDATQLREAIASVRLDAGTQNEVEP